MDVTVLSVVKKKNSWKDSLKEETLSWLMVAEGSIHGCLPSDEQNIMAAEADSEGELCSGCGGQEAERKHTGRG